MTMIETVSFSYLLDCVTTTMHASSYTLCIRTCTLPSTRVPPRTVSVAHFDSTSSCSCSFAYWFKWDNRMTKSEGKGRSITNDLEFGKGNIVSLGHPLLNRIADSFVKAAGIGAIQAVTREAYFTAVEGTGVDSSNGVPEIPGAKKHRFPQLRGETNQKSLEAMVKRTGKESLQWGLAPGVYSGLTYGLMGARGAHDWKNSAVAGALTGVAVALTLNDSSHEQVVQGAITGAAISTAANLLTSIF